ncbi:MAG: hypothetical protein ACI9P3_001769 [Bradyrhizobium sp.]|jgi:hypothetical protein
MFRDSEHKTRGVITRESGRSSIPETAGLEPRGRDVLDRPVEPRDDSVEWGAASYP